MILYEGVVSVKINGTAPDEVCEAAIERVRRELAIAVKTLKYDLQRLLPDTHYTVQVED